MLAHHPRHHRPAHKTTDSFHLRPGRAARTLSFGLVLVGLGALGGCLGHAEVLSSPTTPQGLAPRAIKASALTFVVEGPRQSTSDRCPLGSPGCNPENTRGVYNIEGGDFCIETGSTLSASTLTTGLSWPHRFCPVGFVNRDQAVFLRGLWHDSEDPGQYRYALAKLTAELNGAQVTPVAVTAREGQLELTYRTEDRELRTLSGAALGQLTLIFLADERLHELRLGEPTSYAAPKGGSGLSEYPVTWRRQGVASFGKWQALCRGAGKAGNGPIMPASFIGSAQYDPFTARRTVDEAAVTMSCQSGMITRCLERGYRPWREGDSLAAETTEELAARHVACAQREPLDGDGAP